jgi:hypothetical protein
MNTQDTQSLKMSFTTRQGKDKKLIKDYKMKASELRIGNYVWLNVINKNHDAELRQIIHLDKNTITEIKKKVLTPVLLTEEWLLKLGFNKPNNPYGIDFLRRIYRINISETQRLEILVFKNKKWRFKLVTGYNRSVNLFDSNKKPKYVHQLQNLYFALTGEEL